MRITHLGHACLLVDMADRRLLLDPGTFSAGFEDLTGLDAIVVTHQHADHLDVGRFPALVKANPDAALWADPQSAEILRGSGLAVGVLTEGVDFAVGDVAVSPKGQLHAFNHSGVPTVANVGVRLASPGEPTFFHPGDAYDAEPGEVDVLGVPLSAPWTAVRDTIDFVRRIGPASFVPIHDALLSPIGRGLYLNHVGTHGGGDLTLHDLAGQGAVTIQG